MANSSLLPDGQLPLLETKRFIPKWRSDLVSRPRLVRRLTEGRTRALTLISVPAGFGKTTLLAEWLAAPGAPPAAWVSLDPGDNDPVVFWTNLITAIQAVAPDVGGSAKAMLRSAQPAPVESVLTTLINELAGGGDEFAIVLDDYHVVTTESVHRGITFLTEQLPPHIQMVIASRSDPPLPLSRLRGRGELTELRANDLRFTAGEAADFLNTVMKLELPLATIEALERRTEGWITGLQLAAISVRDEPDVEGFVEAFAGTTRYVVDYLVDEILRHQNEDIRAFLLETSILQRFNGALCDAVTERSNSRAVLEQLERSNLFLVPLDDRRDWYRFHHLFADVLVARLRDERPRDEPLLQRRASDWFAERGLHSESVQHAFEAGDPAKTAQLIEGAEPFMRQSRQEATLLRWYRQLPIAEIETRPALSVGFAFALLSNGELGGVDRLLRQADALIDSRSPEGSGEKSLKGEIAIAYAGRSLAVGDLPEAANHARSALQLVGAGNYFWRGAASAILGLIEWSDGRLDEAFQLYSTGMSNLKQAGYISDAIGGSTALADIRVTQGRPDDAFAVLERGLRLAAEQGVPKLRGTADMHVGMGEIHLERGELDAALACLQRSRDQGEHTGFPRHPWRWRVVKARLCESRGEVQQALDLLDEAQRVYVSDFHPDVRPVAAWKALVQIRDGQLDGANRWAEEARLTPTDRLTYLREFEHLVYARLQIARFRREGSNACRDQTIRLLDRLLAETRTGGRTGSAIEVLVARSILADVSGDGQGAEAFLREALVLAESPRFVRVFTVEGDAMRALLRRVAAGGPGAEWAGRLLVSGPNRAAPPPTADTANPLTGREIEILRLIAAGLRNEEIADQLFISHSTVKRHIANAYGKLGVSNRAGAIARLHEMNVL